MANEERNLTMVELYAGGSTLEDIGRRYGVTRERVRQIIARHGAVDAEQARAVRRQARAAEMAAGIETFLASHRAAIEELAAGGASRTEIEGRFQLLLPHVQADLVRESVGASNILFDVDVHELKFSDAVIEAAVWYVLARAEGLKIDRERAIVEMELDEARDVADLLLGAGIAPAAVASVLCLVHAARRHARDNDGVGLSARRYNMHRESVLSEFGLQSDRGAAVWPPTSQTIMKRLGSGSWADAQRAVGLTPDSRGRPRGLLAFDEDDYHVAVRTFHDSAAATGQAATFDGYSHWVHSEERAGRRRPSAPSIRLHFGSWQQARRAVVGSGGGGDAAQPTKATRLLAVTALHDARTAVEELLVQLDIDDPTDRVARVEDFVRTSMQEFEYRRRKWLRGAALGDPTAVARRLHSGAPSRKEREKLEAGEAADVLTDMYLDRIGARDPRETSHWLRPDAQAELDQVTDDVVARFCVLREYRNLLTHGSVEAKERLVAALATLAQADPLFATNQPMTARTLGSWLVARQQTRLRLLVDSIIDLWRAMVVAEGLLQAN